MNRENGSVFFAKMFEGILCITLAGLVIVSKMRYLWKDLSFLNSLLITLIVILKAKWVQKCITCIIAKELKKSSPDLKGLNQKMNAVDDPFVVET